MLNQDLKRRLKEIVGSKRFLDDPETIVSYSYDGFVEEALPM